MSQNTSSPSPFQSGSDLEEKFNKILSRIDEKIDDYDSYALSLLETRSFNVFFDLAQEFDSIESLLTVAVLIVNKFWKIETEAYLVTSQGTFERFCCSSGASCRAAQISMEDIPTDTPSTRDNACCIPIRGKEVDNDLLPLLPVNGALGMLVLRNQATLTEHQQLFFQKYANRIGYQLHNRLLYLKHKEHLTFIRTLVHDIGHNVIAPNLYFKLLFKQLDGKMQAMRDALEEQIQISPCAEAIQQLDYIQQRMDEQYTEVYRHFQQTSMFLETLLRQSHFDEGHYVLHKSVVNVYKRIVGPQLERYQTRLEEKGIVVNPPSVTKVQDELLVTADVGLISQVIANLLSNAVKYTREAAELGGAPTKYLRCSIKRLPHHFGSGSDGGLIEIFTTGEAISAEDAPCLFNPDFRGHNVGREYGTGHGLFFVREIVELHGGQVGHEAWVNGNSFYFILPCEPA